MMKRAAWITDIHLEFLQAEEISSFFKSIRDLEPDVVLVEGDIGIASNLFHYLEKMEKELQRPIYFVLGNHDFYGGSIKEIRLAAKDFSCRSRNVTYLAMGRIVELTLNTGLVGHTTRGEMADMVTTTVQK